MPWAIFYDKGYAIHAIFETSRLGSRASRGCTRLEIGTAEDLYRKVFAEGKEYTYVIIQE